MPKRQNRKRSQKKKNSQLIRDSSRLRFTVAINGGGGARADVVGGNLHSEGRERERDGEEESVRSTKRQKWTLRAH